MIMEEKFKDVLDKDEKIIKVLKPNKKRYYKSFIFPWAIPIFWPHALMLLVLSGFTLPILIAKAYKKSYFAYTNKRLIVRSGIFGVSFNSLEYKDITATSIDVGMFDKDGKTGSLKFVSPSVHAGKPISFSYIENPYEEMKQIKEIIDANK